jgi:hypothetical protein
MSLMAVIVAAFSIYLLVTQPTATKIGQGFSFLPNNAYIDVLAMVVLLTLYQFCVMDMWQRCIASAQSDIESTPEKAGNEKDEEMVHDLKRKVFIQSIIPFSLFFIAFYLIGFAVRYIKPTADLVTILQFFLSLFDRHSDFLLFMKAIVIVGFAAAAISTVDAFLIAAVQTWMYDIYGIIIKPGLTEKIPYMNVEEKNRFVHFSRFFVVVFGYAAILFAFFQFELIQFWTSMYSLMLAFFPPVYVAMRKKHNYDGNKVLIGIILGAFSALILGVLGTFILHDSNYSNAAPISSLVISSIFLFIAKRK